MKVPTDLEEAAQCFETALHHKAASISVQMHADRTLLSFLDVFQGAGHEADLVAEATIQLAPLLSPPSLHN